MIDELLSALFNSLNIITNTAVLWVYQSVSYLFGNWKVAAGILLGILIVYKVFIDK